MKKMKKLTSILLAIVMILSLATTAFAATGTGSITISNAAKGETYKVYKLFDAKVTGTTDGPITYTGTIPEELKTVFTTNDAGNIVVIEGKSDAEVTAAVQAWALAQEDETNENPVAPAATKVGTGAALVFDNLAYGYYAITTTQGAVVTIDSTNPNVTVVDKNSGTPTLTKTVDDTDVFIGQTVEYTVTYTGYNYDGAGTDAKQIVSYTIEDTLPSFLKDVEVTGITIDGEAYTVNGAVPQFADKKITIPWVDDNGESLYNNGAEIKITYTAVVTEDAAIDGAGNTNKVTLTWETTDGPAPDKLEAETTIYTFAIAVKKVDQDGNPLSGATFQFPFYVQETPDDDGAYIYAGTTEGEGLVNQITTSGESVIIVKGVATGTYTITETSAPDGYNKIPDSVDVTAVQTGKTTTSQFWYIDENGNITETSSETTTEVTLEIGDIAAVGILVVNKAGTELPSTGGMGTTLFYVIGGLLAVAAVVLLVTKKRMHDAA